MSFNPGILAAALIGCVAASSASAEGHYYGALDVGQSMANDACTGNASYVSGCSTNAFSYRVSGGYLFDQIAGIEASYANYGSASAGQIPYGITMDWEASGVQLAGFGIVQVANNVGLVGKVGVARTNLKISGSASASATTTKPVIGAGVQYDLDQRYSLRFMYESLGIIGSTATGTTKFTLLSVGGLIKF